MLAPAKALSKQTFQRVAAYRPGYLFSSYRESESGTRTRILTDQDRHTGVAASEIVLENLLEIDRAR